MASYAYNRIDQDLQKIEMEIQKLGRRISVGVQFREVAISQTAMHSPTGDIQGDMDDGTIYYTGRLTKIYGGIYDPIIMGYVDNAHKAIAIDVSPAQYDLIECDSEIIEVSGARGSGKTRGVTLRCIREILERPCGQGRSVADVELQTEASRDAVLEFLPVEWVLRYTAKQKTNL